MTERSDPPIVSIIGRKNSGKTTLVVALAAELKRRGFHVASVKHGHHAFEIDEPGRDSWRHFHEGGVGAVMMIGAGKVALVARAPAEPDPRELIRRHLGGGGFDLVLVEGYKHGPFPRVEIHRSSVHAHPLTDEGNGFADRVALLTDRPPGGEGYPVIPLAADGYHVAALADLLELRFLRTRTGGH